MQKVEQELPTTYFLVDSYRPFAVLWTDWCASFSSAASFDRSCAAIFLWPFPWYQLYCIFQTLLCPMSSSWACPESSLAFILIPWVQIIKKNNQQMSWRWLWPSSSRFSQMWNWVKFWMRPSHKYNTQTIKTNNWLMRNWPHGGWCTHQFDPHLYTLQTNSLPTKKRITGVIVSKVTDS